MELFIYKEFIDDFFSIYEGENKYDSILRTVLKEYSEKVIKIDCHNVGEFMKRAEDNPFLEDLIEHGADIDYLKDMTDWIENNPFGKQRLILTNKDEAWCNDQEKNGSITLNIKNYRRKIEYYTGHQLNFKKDLSASKNNGFGGWADLKIISDLPLNSIIISDRHIISDKDNQKIDHNLIPLLQNLVCGNNDKAIPIMILTDEITKVPNKERQLVEKILKKINSRLAKKEVSISIVKLFPDSKKQFDLHDRIIYSNFFMLECPRGFNLFASGKRILIGNSKIELSTIFDKFTYYRIKTHLEEIKKKITELRKPRTNSNLNMSDPEFKNPFKFSCSTHEMLLENYLLK